MYPHHKNLSLKSFREMLRYFCFFLSISERGKAGLSIFRLSLINKVDSKKDLYSPVHLQLPSSPRPCHIIVHFQLVSFRNDSNNYYKSSQELLDDLKNILKNKIEPKLLNLFHKKPSAKLLIEGKESIKRSASDYEIFSILFILKGYLVGLQAVTCRVLWTEADQGNSSPILETTRPNLNMK